MPKWILHMPVVGRDDELLQSFSKEEEGLLDSVIDGWVRETALGVWVEWL